ncbi:PREDICTED: uncharacterized protein LOC109468182 [Branchiostoma belcheri]|uniref:Uncharacterized protein LOC109468182 n=1 Tax=Branchiostoma belcheri TaxID=7741 RepID=A0A6P4YXK7_BRABE|nr:PREDICTED: uncharacterized protein LOC109468182 [Branchiostoma belcheri]
MGDPGISIKVEARSRGLIQFLKARWPFFTNPTKEETGCIVFIISCHDLDGLRELWMNYKLGKVNRFLEDLFARQARLSSVETDTDLEIKIDKGDFYACRQHLLLTSPIDNGYRMVRLGGPKFEASTAGKQQGLSEDFPVYCKPISHKATCPQLDFMDPAVPMDQLVQIQAAHKSMSVAIEELLDAEHTARRQYHGRKQTPGREIDPGTTRYQVMKTNQEEAKGEGKKTDLGAETDPEMKTDSGIKKEPDLKIDPPVTSQHKRAFPYEEESIQARKRFKAYSDLDVAGPSGSGEQHLETKASSSEGAKGHPADDSDHSVNDRIMDLKHKFFTEDVLKDHKLFQETVDRFKLELRAMLEAENKKLLSEEQSSDDDKEEDDDDQPTAPKGKSAEKISTKQSSDNVKEEDDENVATVPVAGKSEQRRMSSRAYKDMYDDHFKTAREYLDYFYSNMLGADVDEGLAMPWIFHQLHQTFTGGGYFILLAYIGVTYYIEEGKKVLDDLCLDPEFVIKSLSEAGITVLETSVYKTPEPGGMCV